MILVTTKDPKSDLLGSGTVQYWRNLLPPSSGYRSDERWDGSTYTGKVEDQANRTKRLANQIQKMDRGGRILTRSVETKEQGMPFAGQMLKRE
jgi:hypothetical protein